MALRFSATGLTVQTDFCDQQNYIFCSTMKRDLLISSFTFITTGIVLVDTSKLHKKRRSNVLTTMGTFNVTTLSRTRKYSRYDETSERALPLSQLFCAHFIP